MFVGKRLNVDLWVNENGSENEMVDELIESTKYFGSAKHTMNSFILKLK